MSETAGTLLPDTFLLKAFYNYRKDSISAIAFLPRAHPTIQARWVTFRSTSPLLSDHDDLWLLVSKSQVKLGAETPSELSWDAYWSKIKELLLPQRIVYRSVTNNQEDLF